MRLPGADYSSLSVLGGPFRKSIRGTTGLMLEDLDLYHADPTIFKEHNETFFNAVRDVSGRLYIVDLSKDLKRLERLRDEAGFPVRPVHLVRSPYGVVYSHLKRRRNAATFAGHYLRVLLRTRAYLADMDHYFVRYEKLVSAPREVVTGIMEWLGLSFEEEQMNWGDHEHHHIAGNKLRRLRDGRIQAGEAWKKGLNAWQKLNIFWITLPMRFPGRRARKRQDTQ